MLEDVGRDIRGKIGKFIEVEKRSWQIDQANFIRIRVDLQIDKSLGRGGYITSLDGKCRWVTFKYERLPIVYFICGRLRHDDKHCPTTPDWQNATHQYGEWLNVGWKAKMANKDRANINGSQGTSKEHRLVGKTRPTTDDIEIIESENSKKFENSSGKESCGKEETLGVANVTRMIGLRAAKDLTKCDSFEKGDK